MNIAGAYLGYGLLFSEIGLALWRRSSQQSGNRKMDGSSLRVLWIIIMCSMVAGAELSRRGFGPRLPSGRAMEWCGVAVFVAGTALRWWSILYLGKFFTVDVAISTDHRVVDTGPYRWIRHPSYSGLLLQFAGVSLTMGRLMTVAVVVIPIMLALSYRIRVEEITLRNGLGEDYRIYMDRTKRLIPWLF